MATLILPPRYTSDSNALWKAAINAGWDVARLQSWRAPDALRGTDLAVYAEPLFAAAIADQLGLTLLEPPRDWLSTLPRELTRRKVQFGALSDARRLDGAAFIKPAEDKIFEARVYESGGELSDLAGTDGDTPVLMAEPVNWNLEVRCFVLNGEVVAFSPYWRGGQTAQTDDGTWPLSVNERDEAMQFAVRVLQETQLPPAMVLDLGVIDGRGWGVVEANAAWSSGLYGCDPNEVLRVVQRACLAGTS